MYKSKNLLLSFMIIAVLGLLVFTSDSCTPNNDSEGKTTTETTGATPEVLTSSQGVPQDAWEMPVDATDSTDQNSYYQLGWESFIALNWPADPSYPGKPDTDKTLGDNAQNVVWESYKEKYDIFLPEAEQPDAWTQTSGHICGTDSLPAGTKVLGSISKRLKSDSSDIIIDEFDEAGVSLPLIDQSQEFIRFEIRVCESEFQYIYHNQYYNGAKQIADVKANNFAPFPRTGSGKDSTVMGGPVPAFAQFGATEVKASWRVIPAGQDASRYYSRSAYMVNPDGTCSGEVTIGLVGLHILRLTPSTPSTWYWASFEQVDNIELDAAYGGTLPAHPLLNTQPPQEQTKGYSYEPEEIKAGQPLPSNPTPVLVSRTDSIPSALETLNLQYNQQLRGTVWQYYKMVGAVNPPTTGHNIPADGLAPAVNVASMYNTTLETYTQGNCISCHKYGFPQGAAVTPDDSGNQIFTFLLGDAKSPSN